MATKSSPDFQILFSRFKNMLTTYMGESLHAHAEEPNQYELIGPPTPSSKGRDVWFVRRGLVRTTSPTT